MSFWLYVVLVKYKVFVTYRCEDHLEVHSSYGLLEKYCKDYTAEKVIHIDSSLSGRLS